MFVNRCAPAKYLSLRIVLTFENKGHNSYDILRNPFKN